MRKLVFLAALATSSALAAPAFAQDSTAPSGFRVGVVTGLDIVRPGSSEDSDISGDDQSIEGFQYGVEAGYDVPIGTNVVAGIEAELSDSTAKTKNNTSDPNFFGYGSVKTGRDIYVGARLGYMVAPTTMLYAKGGYTNARLDVTAGRNNALTDENFQLDGWRVGAGVEQSLGRNTYAKLEYRYSKYTDADFQYANGATTDTFSVDTDRHQIVAGVGVRF